MIELTKSLIYCPDSGIISSKKTGEPRGYKRKDGYILIRFQSKVTLAHRAIWTVVNGDPKDQCIDHINRVRDDNRLSNLRLCNRSQNSCNRGTPRGVNQTKSGRYRARIKLNGIQIALGTYDTEQEAVDAYVAAREHYFGVFK